MTNELFQVKGDEKEQLTVMQDPGLDLQIRKNKALLGHY